MGEESNQNREAATAKKGVLKGEWRKLEQPRFA